MTENLMNPLKIGIFMWYDNNIKDYGETNHKINKIYCDKYGYTLIKSDKRLYSERKPHWERFPLLLEYFDKYDYLIWIDADAHFYIDSPPITNVINEYPDKVIIISEDQCCTNPKIQVNTGVFIVKNCLEGKEILNMWGYNEQLYKKMNNWNGWNDQAILREMYKVNLLNIYEKSLIVKYGVLQYFYESDKLPEKIFGLKDKPFIFHLAGSKHKERIKHSVNYFNEYLLHKYNQYLHSNIQLAKSVIKDILNNCENKKMLVFGLGYDSELWYNATNKNTFFIENNQQYIDLNKNINSNNIIYHKYDNITVKNSLKLTEKQINNFKIPNKILELAPFDIILIDGPNGFNDQCPGRLLPIFWSKKYLSKEGTIIYIDDVNRNLENKCINKYLLGKPKSYFKERDGSMKVIM